MKVVFGGQIARPPVLAALRQVPGIELVEADDVPDVVPHLARAEALVIANPRGGQGAGLAAALRAPGCSVRWIQMVSAGFDGLAQHGIPAGIRVTNQGGAAAPAVAEHAMALLLALSRRLDLASADTASARWEAEGLRKHLRSVEGSAIAVVGMGNIGREFARRARAFGARVAGFSRSGEALPDADTMHRLAELPELAGRFDTLVSCIALVPQTRHLLDAALFALCKPGALLVNVSRGEIVDPVALEAALRSGQLAGAALDVTEPEPLPPSASLWQAPNLIVTPHVAPVGNKQVGARIAGVVRENLRRFMAGEPLLHQVEVAP